MTEAYCVANGGKLTDKCPTNSKYGKSCGCLEKFKYNSSNCKDNKTPSGESCGGKYESCGCDPNIYKYKNTTDCKSPNKIDYNDYCIEADNSYSYKTCSCSTEYSLTCTGNLEGVGEACGGKYTSCRCKSNFTTCNNGAAAGAETCEDSSGKKYSNCQADICPSGTVDANVYWGGSLKYFINTSNGVTVGTKNCVTLPSCESLGYSRTCSTEIKLTCPFDSSKTYCLD